MSNDNEQTVNPAALARLRELGRPGEPDLLGELIDLYLADAPKLMNDLRQAVWREDAAAARKIAHTLKGSCGNLGTERLARLCLSLETLAKTGSLNGAEQTLADMERESQAVNNALMAEKTK